jgi:hypothetical protein
MTKRLFPLVAMVAVLSVGFSVPGAAQGRVFRGGRSVVVVGGGFYASPFWYGYPYGFADGYPWYAYQYPIGPYPPYGGYYRLDPGSAVRLEVTPKEAEVYVDGFYAGIVDDFDGVFQRLPIRPGNHEITLYRDGFRTFHQTVYVAPRTTLKVKNKMQPLVAGDVAEPRPTPPAPPAGVQGDPNQPGPNQPGPNQPGPPPPTVRGQFGRRLPPPPPNQPGARSADASTFGTLSIRVQPDGANVLVDGERWDGPQGQNRLIIEVPEGTHRVEIQREGFEPYSAGITVRRGETTPLNVSLRAR